MPQNPIMAQAQVRRDHLCVISSALLKSVRSGRSSCSCVTRVVLPTGQSVIQRLTVGSDMPAAKAVAKTGASQVRP